MAKAIRPAQGSSGRGRACAANPTAIVIPCHRVVRKDGGLGGYRWGTEIKQALLAKEKVENQ